MINIAITSYDIGEPPIYKNVGGFPHLLPIDYNNILDYLDSQNITEFNIIGGEPAIHADFEEIMYITNCFVNKHPSAKINLYTSGYNLCEKIPLLGVNTNIILQWLENDVKISSEINKEILKTFQKLYELNYFATNKAILEIPIGVLPMDYSFLLSLIKQYNIKTIQIKFIPLYIQYDDEKKYNYLKSNFFNLLEQISGKIIINPIDCIPWCQFSKEEKEIIKQKHIKYPVIEKINIIFYDNNQSNSHIMDSNYCNYENTSILELQNKIYNMNNVNNLFSMCQNCNKFQYKKCLGRQGRI